MSDARYEQAVEQHYEYVLDKNRAFHRDHRDAEEATQDAFRLLQTHIHKLDDSRILPWVRWIARRKGIDLIRKAVKRRDTFITSLDEVGEAYLMDQSIPAPDRTDLPILRKALEDEIEKLPLECRICFVLHYFDQQDWRQISEALGIPPLTVTVRLQRARRILRRKLCRES